MSCCRYAIDTCIFYDEGKCNSVGVESLKCLYENHSFNMKNCMYYCSCTTKRKENKNMSNGYNDWKKDMESCVKYSKDKTIHAVQYLSNADNIDAIGYEFCDLLCEDTEEITLRTRTYPEEEPKFENILKLQVGDDYDNHDGTWTKNYKYTIYVRESDWVLYDSKTDKMFVVDNAHIGEYI